MYRPFRLIGNMLVLEFRDLPSGTLTLVSRADKAVAVVGGGGASATHDPQGNSQVPGNLRVVSADGRFTVFTSTAANLVPGQLDTNTTNDIFVYDRVLNATTLVSHSASSPNIAAKGSSDYPTISADGQFIAYVSSANNLVAGFTDGNGSASDRTDVFLFDRSTGTTTLISRSSGSPLVSGNKRSLDPVLSADGKFVAFNSAATDLVAGFSPNTIIISDSEGYLYDRLAGTTTVVSHGYSSPLAACQIMAGYVTGLSDDGQFVFFHSGAPDVVSPISSAVRGDNLYVFDRSTGNNTLLSHPPGQPTSNGNMVGGLWPICRSASASADGRYVAFATQTRNLVSGFTDGNAPQDFDVYLADRVTDAITLVSHVPGSAITSGNAASATCTISADGRFVLYASDATDLISGFSNNGAGNYFIFDRLTGNNTLVTHGASAATAGSNGSNFSASISGDGHYVVFTSEADNLLSGFVNNSGPAASDVYVFDRFSGNISLVSRTTASAVTAGNAASNLANISQNGQAIAFTSEASDLVPNDANQQSDVMIFDTGSMTNALASRRAQDAASVTANGNSTTLSYPEDTLNRVSDDGRYLVYVSTATNLIPGICDTNSATDLFLYDQVTGVTTLVSHSITGVLDAANGSSASAAISGDGRYVAFNSFATDLVAGFVDANGPTASDNYIFDRVAGTTVLLSHSISSLTTGGNQGSGTPPPNTYEMAISADGRYVAYPSYATDLIPGFIDNNFYYWNDVFLYDRVTGTNQLVSHSAADPNGGGTRLVFGFPSISADGRFVVFSDHSDNLIAGVVPYGDAREVFLFDRLSNSLTLVSHAAASSLAIANGGSSGPAISPDGQFVAYTSSANNLVAGGTDFNGGDDIFIYERATGINTLVSHAAGSPNDTGDDRSEYPSISSDGRYVSYASEAKTLVAGFVDHNGYNNGFGADVFVFDRVTGLNALVSHTSQSLVDGGNGASTNPEISKSGRVITFGGRATDLVNDVIAPNPGLTNMFIFDRFSGTNKIISYVPASNQSGDALSRLPAISGDGSIVYFDSNADNLVANDFNGFSDIFAYSNLPAVQSAKIADGSVQRSVVRSLTLTFDQQITFVGDPAMALVVTRTSATGPQGNVGLSASVTTNGGTTTVTLTFSGPLTQFGSLIDGTYRVTALASQISAAGPLDGNNDGFGGDDYVLDFYRLFGDANGDRHVNASDFVLLLQSYGTNAITFDFDGDGDNDALDFGQFRRNFGAMI